MVQYWNNFYGIGSVCTHEESTKAKPSLLCYRLDIRLLIQTNLSTDVGTFSYVRFPNRGSLVNKIITADMAAKPVTLINMTRKAAA